MGCGRGAAEMIKRDTPLLRLGRSRRLRMKNCSESVVADLFVLGGAGDGDRDVDGVGGPPSGRLDPKVPTSFSERGRDEAIASIHVPRGQVLYDVGSDPGY